MSPASPDRKKRREGGRRICHCHRLLLLLLLPLFLFSFVLLGKEGLGCCGRTEGAIYILMAFRCDGPRARKRGLRKMEEATTIRVPKKVTSLDQKRKCMGHVFGRKRATRETKKPSNHQNVVTAFKFVHTCKYSCTSQKRKVATFLLGLKTTKVV